MFISFKFETNLWIIDLFEGNIMEMKVMVNAFNAKF